MSGALEKLTLQQHLCENRVLNIPGSPVLVPHHGELEVPRVANSGHGNVELAVREGL